MLFDNTTGGMKNLPVVFFIPMLGIKILILVLFDKILVLFDRSIRIPRAHVRIHKVFYPCNRCHLATLLENQRVTCGNEVTRVTTNGDFALNIHSTQIQRHRVFIISPYLCVYQTTACGLRSPGLRGSEVPPPGVEGAASVGRRCRLQKLKL